MVRVRKVTWRHSSQHCGLACFGRRDGEDQCRHRSEVLSRQGDELIDARVERPLMRSGDLRIGQ